MFAKYVKTTEHRMSFSHSLGQGVQTAARQLYYAALGRLYKLSTIRVQKVGNILLERRINIGPVIIIIIIIILHKNTTHRDG